MKNNNTLAEEVKALYFDKDALIVQPQVMYRLNAGGGRLYYRYDEKGDPEFFISVTTLIRDTLPTPPSLIKWIAEKGLEESQQISGAKADYGTFMHVCIGDLLINRKFDFDGLPERLEAYCAAQQLDLPTVMGWEEDIKKDLLAMAAFVAQYKVKPLAIEIILTHFDGYAGAIDLVCEMTIPVKGFWGEEYKSGDRKGQPKESNKDVVIRAIIDFKSGKKGFFESHEIQLEAYRRIWNWNYPDYPVDKIYNWSPKDWRSAPDFNLKDQSDSSNLAKLDYLIQLAKLEESKRDRRIKIIEGVIDLEKGWEPNLREVPLFDLIKERRVKDKPKEETK